MKALLVCVLLIASGFLPTARIRGNSFWGIGSPTAPPGRKSGIMVPRDTTVRRCCDLPRFSPQRLALDQESSSQSGDRRAVPEPASLFMLGTGLLGLAGLLWRKTLRSR